jgi:hypothetical protein
MVVDKKEGRMIKVLKSKAGFGSSEERRRYGQNYYGQNNGQNYYTTQSSFLGFLNPTTPRYLKK